MILVDTHAAIWLTDDQDEISRRALDAILMERASGGIAVSAITLWEIGSLMRKGRITVAMPLLTYLGKMETVFVVLPIDARVAERSFGFGSLYPKDPADRIIGATAVVHGLKLVTRDKQIRSSGEVDCIW